MIRFINIKKEVKMEDLHKKDIEIYKKEIERLYKKIDYLEELDRKNFLQIIKFCIMPFTYAGLYLVPNHSHFTLFSIANIFIF